MRLDKAQAVRDRRTQSSIDKGDLPVVDVSLHEFELPAALREHEVVGYRFFVLEEVVLDDIGLIAEAENEVLVAEVRIVLHDMPQAPAAHPIVTMGFGTSSE